MRLFVIRALVTLQGSKIVNLQRKGKDPEPILLSYIPALDAIRKMFADVNNKKGFVLEPQVRLSSKLLQSVVFFPPTGL